MTAGQRRDVIPTRAMLRELKAERRVAKEGQDFLDQKRMILATEMLRRIREAEAIRSRLDERRHEAAVALVGGLARHGLEGLAYHPAEGWDVAVDVERERFIGVPVVRTHLRPGTGRDGETHPEDGADPPGMDGPPVPSSPVPAPNPSPEARRVAAAFRELLPDLAELAGIMSSLYRLGKEYRQTNRRVRALERVLMPEIEGTLQKVTEVLDEQDQEEAIYARLSRSEDGRSAT